MSGALSKVVIRPCRGFDEFDVCVRLQIETWGYDPLDVVPQREFVVIERIGGQILGAFDIGRSNRPEGDSAGMVGFAMAMPGYLDGRTFLHSHMLAVLPEYRDAGIGRRLKLAQRDEALSRGIRMMEWTFDPLEIKNAHLNITRLGAIVESYTANLYGVFSSRLQAGLPPDRLHAEWWLDSPRVYATLKGGPVVLPEIQETIVVPGAIRSWRDSPSDIERARAAQSEVRARFLDAFERRLAVVGFSKSEEGDGVYALADRQSIAGHEL